MGSLDTSREIDQMREAASGMANRMSTIADQVGQRVSTAAERVSDKAGGVLDKAGGALATAQEKGAAAANSANEVAGTLRDALAQSARSQPITTIALAVGAGFLLGAIWRSGR